jgi:hypothetical protein
MNWNTKESGVTPTTTSNKDTLSYTGSGKVSVSVSSIINSPNVQRQVTSVREIAASQSQLAAKSK